MKLYEHYLKIQKKLENSVYADIGMIANIKTCNFAHSEFEMDAWNWFKEEKLKQWTEQSMYNHVI